MAETGKPLVHVHPSQIAAATLIHDRHFPGWAGTDRALTLLARSVPGLDLDAITLKAVVVDRLYSTRHYRLGHAIGRVVEVMAEMPDGPIAPARRIAFVEAIAPITVGDKPKWHWSFASKFSHWFVDDSLPIYDSWATWAVTHHFDNIEWQPKARYYRVLAEHVYALWAASGLSCTIREMDRYLWLSGMYRAWMRAKDRGKLGLSGEVQGLFGNDDPDVQHALTALLGEVQSP